MQQYFIDFEMFQNNIITGDDVFHISTVMRMKNDGEIIVCYDKKTYIAQIKEISKKSVGFVIKEEIFYNSELPVNVTVLQGYPKSDKMEFICQKATELGASVFFPCYMDRSVVKIGEDRASKKTTRLQRIAKEAAEQSHRLIIPHVHDIIDLKKVDFSNYDYLILAYEEAAKQGEKKELKRILSSLRKGSNILICIGPEGGISDKEYEYLTKNGFVSCSFGPRILRCESAALYFLSALSYELELE